MKMNVLMAFLGVAAVCRGEIDIFDSGGMVTKPDPANGKIVIVNEQTRVDASAVEASATFVHRMAFLPTLMGDATTDNAKVVVHVRDLADAPAIIVEPDELRATVNVGALSQNANDHQLRERTIKAIVRAIFFVCGGGGSLYPRTLNGPIGMVTDYDKTPLGAVSPDTYQRMAKYLKPLGVRTETRLSYEGACEEGWAPKPTNDVQRAIWEKVNTPPTKPLKITYDKAAQKPVVK